MRTTLQNGTSYLMPPLALGTWLEPEKIKKKKNLLNHPDMMTKQIKIKLHERGLLQRRFISPFLFTRGGKTQLLLEKGHTAGLAVNCAI